MWILCDSNDYAEFDLKISHFAVIFIDLFTSVSTDLEFLARKYRMAIEKSNRFWLQLFLLDFNARSLVACH